MWTLESAREHYRKQNPKCDSCEFCSKEKNILSDGFHEFVCTTIYCNITNKQIPNKSIAKDCIYYTIK